MEISSSKARKKLQGWSWPYLTEHQKNVKETIKSDVSGFGITCLELALIFWRRENCIANLSVLQRSICVLPHEISQNIEERN